MKNSKHENIIELYDVIFHPNKEGEQLNKKGNVYLIMEKMDSDL